MKKRLLTGLILATVLSVFGFGICQTAKATMVSKEIGFTEQHYDTFVCSKCSQTLDVSCENQLAKALGLDICTKCWMQVVYGNDTDPIATFYQSDTTATGAELEELTDGSETTLHTHAAASAPGLTVALFQENAAAGTFNATPDNVNDDNTPTQFGANAEAQYAEVDFGKNVTIYQYRLYGDDLNNDDGVWKIEYYDESWHDWITGIATNEAVWTNWIAGTVVVCSKIRLTCTTVDSFGSSLGRELEIKWG